MEYYSTVKAIDVLKNLHDLKGRMLSVKSQSLKVTPFKIPFVEHSLNKIIEIENRRVVASGYEASAERSGYGCKGIKRASCMETEQLCILIAMVVIQIYACDKIV